MSILPKRRPYWMTGAHTDGPVFDIYWLGLFSLVFDRSRKFYPRGWTLQWHDDD